MSNLLTAPNCIAYDAHKGRRRAVCGEAARRRTLRRQARGLLLVLRRGAAGLTPPLHGVQGRVLLRCGGSFAFDSVGLRTVLIGISDFGDRAVRAGTGRSISWSARRFRGGRMRRARRRRTRLSFRPMRFAVWRGWCGGSRSWAWTVLGYVRLPLEGTVCDVSGQAKEIDALESREFPRRTFVFRPMLIEGRSHVTKQGPQLAGLADVCPARACSRELPWDRLTTGHGGVCAAKCG